MCSAGPNVSCILCIFWSGHKNGIQKKDCLDASKRESGVFFCIGDHFAGEIVLLRSTNILGHINLDLQGAQGT